MYRGGVGVGLGLPRAHLEPVNHAGLLHAERGVGVVEAGGLRLGLVWRLTLCEWLSGRLVVVARVSYEVCRGGWCGEIRAREFGWLCEDGGCEGVEREARRFDEVNLFRLSRCRRLVEARSAGEWRGRVAELASGALAGKLAGRGEVPGAISVFTAGEDG